MKNKKGISFIIVGVVAILAAASITVYNVVDAKRAEKTAAEAYSHLAVYIENKEKEVEDYTRYEEVVYIPDYQLVPEVNMPVEEIDGYKYVGVLEIPSLSKTLPVLDECNNSLLKVAPCRYVGTAYKKGFVIGAHNYSSHFADLKYLSPGDEVIFRDMAGNSFTYSVVTQESLSPTDVEEMKSEEWDLTLFTCTPGGRTRVTVRCELAG